MIGYDEYVVFKKWKNGYLSKEKLQLLLSSHYISTTHFASLSVNSTSHTNLSSLFHTPRITTTQVTLLMYINPFHSSHLNTFQHISTYLNTSQHIFTHLNLIRFMRLKYLWKKRKISSIYISTPDFFNVRKIL